MSDDRPSESASEAATSPDGDSPRADVTGFAAFRHRDFRIFYFAKAFAVGSFHMNLVAVLYQLYDLTGDPLTVALVSLSMLAPVLILVPYSGYVADTFDRRLVLLGCYVVLTGSAVGLFLLTFFGIHEPWAFYAVLLLAGLGRAFYGPTTNALVPNLVPVSVFPNAVAWNTSAGRMAQILGPTAGGFLYLLGPEAVYGVAAVTFIFGGLTTAMLKAQPSSRRGRGANLRNLLSGLRYVLEKRIILGTVVIDIIMMLMGGVQALLPVFAKDILEVGASGAGLLRSAMAVGGLIMALTLTRYAIRRGVGKLMLLATAIFGAATVVFGLSTSFALSLVAIAVVGGCDVVSSNIRQTLMQIATPDQLRGRVGAVNSLSANVGNELGGFRAGAFTALMGPEAAVVLGGVVVIGFAVGYPKIFPELARVERMDRELWADKSETGPDSPINS